MKEEAMELLEKAAMACSRVSNNYKKTTSAEDAERLEWYVGEARQIFVLMLKARDVEKGNEADWGEVDLETGPGIAGTPDAKKDPWGAPTDTRGYPEK